MEEDIKKIVDQYVKAIEEKEADLVSFKQKVDHVLHGAQLEMNKLMSDLDLKFDENNLTEEEYLNLLRVEKEKILQKVKVQLDSLVKDVEASSQSDGENQHPLSADYLNQ